jgi:hypothetical protein
MEKNICILSGNANKRAPPLLRVLNMYKHRNTTRCTSMMYGKTINMKVVDRLGRAISANMKVRNLYLKEKCIITSL